MTGALHICSVLASCDLAWARGRAKVPMREDVHAPVWFSELVEHAQRRHQMCAVVECRFGYCPRLSYMVIGVFDTDTGGVGVPVACVPRSIAIPYELPDCAIFFYLIVCGRFACLPHIPALLNAQPSRVVVHDDFIDLAPTAPTRVMLIKNQINIRLKSIPILHCSYIPFQLAPITA